MEQIINHLSSTIFTTALVLLLILNVAKVLVLELGELAVLVKQLMAHIGNYDYKADKQKRVRRESR